MYRKIFIFKIANGFFKLPKDDSGFNKILHQLTKTKDIISSDYDKKLTRSHIYFFIIDIPLYSTYDI